VFSPDLKHRHNSPELDQLRWNDGHELHSPQSLTRIECPKGLDVISCSFEYVTAPSKGTPLPDRDLHSFLESGKVQTDQRDLVWRLMWHSELLCGDLMFIASFTRRQQASWTISTYKAPQFDPHTYPERWPLPLNDPFTLPKFPRLSPDISQR